MWVIGLWDSSCVSSQQHVAQGRLPGGRSVLPLRSEHLSICLPLPTREWENWFPPGPRRQQTKLRVVRGTDPGMVAVGGAAKNTEVSRSPEAWLSLFPAALTEYPRWATLF